jgi:hypothetical protein
MAAGGKARRISARRPELKARIDAWRASEGEPQPSRSQAIRFLLEKGLAKGRGKP